MDDTDKLVQILKENTFNKGSGSTEIDDEPYYGEQPSEKGTKKWKLF